VPFHVVLAHAPFNGIYFPEERGNCHEHLVASMRRRLTNARTTLERTTLERTGADGDSLICVTCFYESHIECEGTGLNCVVIFQRSTFSRQAGLLARQRHRICVTMVENLELIFRGLSFSPIWTVTTASAPQVRFERAFPVRR
jgi:hypothetical protein